MRKELSETELAYFAGFLDGEGSFTTKFSKSYVYPRVTVGNTYLPVLNDLLDAFGGNIANKSPAKDGYNRRNAFQWEVTGKRAHRVCELLLPYLREKKPQAELLLSLSKLDQNERFNSSILQQLKELKKVERPKLSRTISNPANVQQTKARRNLRDVAGDSKPSNTASRVAVVESQRKSRMCRTGGARAS